MIRENIRQSPPLGSYSDEELFEYISRLPFLVTIWTEIIQGLSSRLVAKPAGCILYKDFGRPAYPHAVRVYSGHALILSSGGDIQQHLLQI